MRQCTEGDPQLFSLAQCSGALKEANCPLPHALHQGTKPNPLPTSTRNAKGGGLLKDSFGTRLHHSLHIQKWGALRSVHVCTQLTPKGHNNRGLRGLHTQWTLAVSNFQSGN